VDALRGAVSVPVMVKGIMTALDATTAVTHGAQGVVVSNYGRPAASGQPAPLDAVAPIVDAVGARVPVLLDGGIRRGSDVMKALALGARAVLVARPVMWGLAAYGADGVQSVIEMLQTELGRVMGCCGTPNLAAITRRVVKVHASQPLRERA
jgi:isopentenyl diphosphate isomerase/L-lactate dehydrogenase-like FMN-dependent dehydrogenase